MFAQCLRAPSRVLGSNGTACLPTSSSPSSVVDHQPVITTQRFSGQRYTATVVSTRAMPRPASLYPPVIYIVPVVLHKIDSHLGGGSQPAETRQDSRKPHMDTPIVKPRQFTMREDGSLLLLCGRTKSEPGELNVGRGGRAQCVAMFIALIQLRLTFLSFS